jgi:hypothetical protein
LYFVFLGLLAKKAVEKGLSVKPYIKTSNAPGSVTVTLYLEKSGLNQYLEKLGFYTVGYGCTTCIGNSGPLPESVANAIEKSDLVVAGVLSGNRNFEGFFIFQFSLFYFADLMYSTIHSTYSSIGEGQLFGESSISCCLRFGWKDGH